MDVATLRRPVPVRDWQLLVFPPFYEAMGPRHAALTPLPPSKPERPHTKDGTVHDWAYRQKAIYSLSRSAEKVNGYPRSARPRVSWAISFVIARCFKVSRLSYSFFPRAKASSTLIFRPAT